MVVTKNPDSIVLLDTKGNFRASEEEGSLIVTDKVRKFIKEKYGKIMLYYPVFGITFEEGKLKLDLENEPKHS